MEGTRPGYFYFASESVGEGHPDKLCDQISDGVLDACLTQDPHCKVGLESATKTKMVKITLSYTPLGLPPRRDSCCRTQCKLRTDCTQSC